MDPARKGGPRRRTRKELAPPTYASHYRKRRLRSALAAGEIDPRYEGKSVILAYEGGEPPAASAALRLVVPGDAHGGRSVRDVATIEVR